MSYFKELRPYSSGVIDGKTVASTYIGTTENGTQNFVPVFVILHILTSSAVVTMFTYSVGTNSTAYTNILGNTTPLSTLGANAINNSALTAASIVPPNTAMYLNVPTAAIGIGSSVTFSVHVFGFYQ